MHFSKIALSNQHTRETVHPENCNTGILTESRAEGIRYSAFPECRKPEIPSRVQKHLSDDGGFAPTLGLMGDPATFAWFVVTTSPLSPYFKL